MCASYQITLELKIQSRFSKQEINFTRDFVGDEQISLSISSPDINFNQFYEVTVRVNRTGSSSSNLHFSELLFCEMICSNLSIGIYV